MPGRTVLATGGGAETDRGALRRLFDAVVLRALAERPTLPPSERADIAAEACNGHATCGPAAMDGLPGLCPIAHFGVGIDAIDLAAAASR